MRILLREIYMPLTGNAHAQRDAGGKPALPSVRAPGGPRPDGAGSAGQRCSDDRMRKQCLQHCLRFPLLLRRKGGAFDRLRERLHR